MQEEIDTIQFEEEEFLDMEEDDQQMAMEIPSDGIQQNQSFHFEEVPDDLTRTYTMPKSEVIEHAEALFQHLEEEKMGSDHEKNRPGFRMSSREEMIEKSMIDLNSSKNNIRNTEIIEDH